MRQNDKLNLQNDFIFIGTETKRNYYEKTIEEKFYLGWMIYWNRNQNIKEYIFLDKKDVFYKYVIELMKTKKHLFIFAHNTDFDIKVLGGISKFIKNGWIVDSFYINGCRFIIRLKKTNKVIEILDTMNYIPMSLKYIGESIGLKKMEIDFNSCKKDELSIYCKNDTEIIFLFISKLIEFLEKYELSKLKPTVASLSMNIFRHKFYSKKKNPIYIHSWNKAIELERMSYRGGISDCFKIGENIKEKLYKLDINSMYPYIMREKTMPTKLLFYTDIDNDKEENIKKIFFKFLKSKLIIARVKIFLPKEYAYILVKTEINKQSKSMFLSGIYIVSLTTPELNFVLKYGKILNYYNIAIYEHSNIFKDFVDFFYNSRLEFSKNGNEAYKLFCKYILNSLYGKFGQTQIHYIETERKDIEFNSKQVIDTINKDSYLEMSLGNKVFEEVNDGKNSFDSFVAIASFVTSYSRMYLIDMILKTKRENVYYVDTDCLILNKKGFDYLNDFNLINEKELGKFKLEEISEDTTIYRPKYYIFNDKEKCKGVKNNSIKLYEDKNILRVKQENFTKFKTSLRKNTNNKMIVTEMIKEINKVYDKGIIKENGDIEPYEYKM
jgi:hypothetical protein